MVTQVTSSGGANPNGPRVQPGRVEIAGTVWALELESGQTAVVVSAPAGAACLDAFEGRRTYSSAGERLVGPLSPRNAAALRAQLTWLTPVPVGLRTSAGLGDRLGLATPGHVRALRVAGGQIVPVFAQQSIREMTRTGRTPQEVMDAATWGMFAAGWDSPAGADADHLKTPDDIDACLAAGFTWFTVDPGAHVDGLADSATVEQLRVSAPGLPWTALDDNLSGLLGRYAGQVFDVEGHRISFDEVTVLRAAVKYGRAIAHVAAMYRHLLARVPSRHFDLEVSVDETDTPTSAAEHLFVVRELVRLGVTWQSLAPRFVGRFEKGVDYIGDLAEFEREFVVHAAIARQYGPYKISLHSGSDKFSIYPIVARHTRGLVHLKTAGTSYLEALRTIATAAPDVFREIYTFCRGHYLEDRASYHVSAELDRTPEPSALSDGELAGLLDQFDARQVLHVTFGSVLTTLAPGGGLLFGSRLMALLASHPDVYAGCLERHFVRHLDPFCRQV